MQEWIGQHIEVYFSLQSPKIQGVCKSVQPGGLVMTLADDGDALAQKITATFVPFAAIRHVNLMHARSEAEQEAKRKELEERFRRHHLESAAAPHASQIEALQHEVGD